MNLEIPKKFSPIVHQARQVAQEVFRPISRKYDRAEHAYPKELDMFASIMDGMNEGAPDGGAGAGKLARSDGNGKGGNRNDTNMKTVLGLAGVMSVWRCPFQGQLRHCRRCQRRATDPTG